LGEADAVYLETSIVPLVNQATMLEFGGGLTGRSTPTFLSSPMSIMNARSAQATTNGMAVGGALDARYTW
jgi:hypothetical protein